MGALQQLLQPGGTGSNPPAGRTGGHGEEQVSVLRFWMVGLWLCGFFLVLFCVFLKFVWFLFLVLFLVGFLFVLGFAFVYFVFVCFCFKFS